MAHLPDDELDTVRFLGEYHFTSSLPRWGKLIAWLRQQWYNVAARWADNALAGQQNEFNQAVTRRIKQLDARTVELNEYAARLAERANLLDERANLLDERLAEYLLHTDVDLTQLAKHLSQLTGDIDDLRLVVAATTTVVSNSSDDFADMAGE